ncbi:putative ribonuclease H-like domain-containing protein [Tanacetum coccineum]|uniref:Ribonuclease H-like domain-containing protein n=1 Tax=Tanacetum coccineum TaxID=301880 RepID=A0ABQ4YNQ3_9ASTR
MANRDPTWNMDIDLNWQNAMYDEYNALIKTVLRYKASLVANGCSQQFGVDCDDTFSLVVKPNTIRMVLSLALSQNWHIYQLDEKNAFFNGNLSEIVYMYQPLGYAYRVGFSSSRCDSSLFIYQHGSEYIFESMVKNLDNAGKFLMYPRFVQVFLDKQLEGMSSHKRIYVTPSHTKKIFGNMKRVGKGFSGRETPLFPTMVVQNQAEMGEGSAIPTDPHHTPTIIQPSTSQPQKKQRSRRPKRNDTKVPQPSGPTTNVADEAVYEERDDSLEKGCHYCYWLRCRAGQGSENVSKLSNDPLLVRGNTLRSGEDRLKLQEFMELCTNLQNRVIDLENTKTAQAQEITTLKLRVKKLEKKGGSRTHKLKILYKVGRSVRIVSSDEASLGNQEDTSKHGRKIDDIDKDAEITLVHETQGRAMNNLNNKCLKQMQAEEQEDLSIERVKVFAKLEEDKETTELQRLIEVVPDKEEVSIDVIPLAAKPPSIGRIIGIKRLLNDLRVTANKVYVTTASIKVLMFTVAEEAFRRMMVSTAVAWSNNLDGTQALVDQFIAIKFQQQGDLKQSNNKKKEQQIAKVFLNIRVFDVNAALRLLVLLALNAVNTARGEAYDKVFNHLDMLHAPLEGKVLILTTAKSLLLLLV